MGKKFLIASDFHGSLVALEKLMQLATEHRANKVILLGDIFGTNASEMVQMLNTISYKLTIVKGNNDWYFEPENADFKVFNEAYENVNGKIAYLCHGHKLNDMYLEGYGAKIVMIGHVHRPILQKNHDGIILLCPGSLAVPRFGSKKSFAIIDEEKIQILSVDGEVIDEMLLD